MKEITLTIGQQQVYDEVAKTTSYAGAKMADETAYDRIFTTDEDQEMLARFWQESKAMVVTSLKRWLLDEAEEDGAWKIHLGLSQAWDEALADDMQRSVLSVFVLTITAKWFTITDKDDAEGYATQAASHLESLLQKIYHKKGVVRPEYGDDAPEGPYNGQIRVTVRIAEVLYDIENRTALLAEAREASGATYPVVSALRVTDDGDRMYHIKRAIATAFVSLKSASAEYVPAYGWTADNRINEEIENNGELVMVFTLPRNYDRAAVQMLGKGIHDYFVETALGEWLALISAEDSATYATAAASSMLLVRSALNKRRRPRRPQYRKGE